MFSKFRIVCKNKNRFKNKQTNRITSVFAIDIKGAFGNDILLKTMLDMDFPEDSRRWMNYFLSKRRTSLINQDEVIESTSMDLGIPKGL